MGPRVSELLSNEAWDLLEKNPEAVLIDVRTKPEWAFVGRPDVSRLGNRIFFIEWMRYPNMSVNELFLDELMASIGDSLPPVMLFICRSGARSMSAAQLVATSLQGESEDGVACVNVAEGFEGDLDSESHRGGLNGWKARGLPWLQS